MLRTDFGWQEREFDGGLLIQKGVLSMSGKDAAQKSIGLIG